MKFYSTNNRNYHVSLSEGVLQGLAPDGGLYMPETIPTLPASFFSGAHHRSFKEIAFEVIHSFLHDDLPSSILTDIIQHTISFDAPLVEIEKNIFALELFHGPTLAFKDFGARFMSQLLGYFAREQKRDIVILVATSGDTGSAVANGFLGVSGTRVVVMYPSGKVSEMQEKQFTTLGQNIMAIEVSGSFDDCQQMVKSAFADEELRKKYFMTSANSINIARLIPQTLYYFYGWSRLKRRDHVVFSVPSGNFGNLTAGILAMKMGLPVQHFVAATNINDVVPHYLKAKEFLTRSSKSTISNAMDVGNPSNFQRMLDLYRHDADAMANDISGFSFSDDETRKAMKEVYSRSGYVLDPHGAVGYLGLKKYLETKKNNPGIFLETAHPAKFKSTVEETLGIQLKLPESLSKFLNGEKRTVKCEARFDSFKNVLLSSLN